MEAEAKYVMHKSAKGRSTVHALLTETILVTKYVAIKYEYINSLNKKRNLCVK